MSNTERSVLVFTNREMVAPQFSILLCVFEDIENPLVVDRQILADLALLLGGQRRLGGVGRGGVLAQAQRKAIGGFGEFLKLGGNPRRGIGRAIGTVAAVQSEAGHSEADQSRRRADDVERGEGSEAL